MFDLAVIGLGPAGLEAVSVALKQGLKVIAFEEKELGGTCLNVGCIPTKAILHCCNVLNDIKNSSKLGINIEGNVGFDWQQIINRKNIIVEKFNKLLNSALSKNIQLVKSKAKIKIVENKALIEADGNDFKAKNIIIATGSMAVELPNLKFDKEFILNSDDLFNLEKLPKSITIVGSGAIGLEWAKIMSNFGVEVKLIEKAPTLLPNLDVELQKRAERLLKQNKIAFYKNDFIVEAKDKKVVLNSGVEFESDCVLVAVGRKPILPEIISNCEFNILDDLSTNISNVFVAGDSSADIMLAHNASFQAGSVVKNIINGKKIVKKPVPSVVYLEPEFASVGLKEQDIQDNSGYIIKKLMITSLAKSWCDEAADGIIKVIIKDDCIKGAHIVSKDASNLISIFSVLIDKQIKIDEIEEMIFPHPSFAEGILEVIKNG